MSQVDYRACSAAGALIATFSDRDLALKWAKANRRDWPGMTLERVVVTTVRHVIYRPRVALLRLRVVA